MRTFSRAWLEVSYTYIAGRISLSFEFAAGIHRHVCMVSSSLVNVWYGVIFSQSYCMFSSGKKKARKNKNNMDNFIPLSCSGGAGFDCRLVILLQSLI